MPNQVCMQAATMQCSFGAFAPSSLVVLPTNKVFTDQAGVPDANIMDHVPMVNIMPFGMCVCRWRIRKLRLPLPRR